MWLALAGVSGASSAGSHPASSELERHLRQVYEEWKSAMVTSDLQKWARHTARSRQIAVRNTIVSQKRDWPRALFSLAIVPPEVIALRLAGSEVRGAQARLVYFGRVDFRLDRTPPPGALVLDFVKEGGHWKYYGGRYYNLESSASLAQQIAAGQIGAIGGPQGPLTGTPPADPPLCPPPDYAGQIRVQSSGYRTAVSLGPHHQDVITDDATNEIIVGGLQRGANRLRLKVQPLEGAGSEPSLEVSIFALTPHLRTPAVRVFHFQPNNPAAGEYDLTVTVGPSTLQKGNEIQLIPSR